MGEIGIPLKRGYLVDLNAVPKRFQIVRYQTGRNLGGRVFRDVEAIVERKVGILPPNLRRFFRREIEQRRIVDDRDAEFFRQSGNVFGIGMVVQEKLVRFLRNGLFAGDSRQSQLSKPCNTMRN